MHDESDLNDLVDRAALHDLFGGCDAPVNIPKNFDWAALINRIAEESSTMTEAIARVERAHEEFGGYRRLGASAPYRN